MPQPKPSVNEYWVVSEAELNELRKKGFSSESNHSYMKHGKTFFVFPENRKISYPKVGEAHVKLPLEVYAMMKNKPVVEFMQTFSGGVPTSPKSALLRDRRVAQAGKRLTPAKRTRRAR